MIAQHRISASPGHVDVAPMWNAKEHIVYRESAKVDLLISGRLIHTHYYYLWIVVDLRMGKRSPAL